MKSKTEKNSHRELIALSLIHGIGNRLTKRILYNSCMPLLSLFRSNAGDIGMIEGIGPGLARAISSFDRWTEVDQIIKRSDQAGAAILAMNDPGYPHLLFNIYDPPPLLWIRGNSEVLSNPGLAIVGTRRADRYGREQAETWSRLATGSGLTVVSGLAYGIDTVAHDSAVRSGGMTTAILGSGIDRIYPSRNRKLAESIISGGGVIATEFPPGTKPAAPNFPKRNRVVSGLSFGVLVVQSGISGGSMITARSALDENREVFVIPQSLGQERGAGNNYLIKTGQGKLVQEFDDILSEIPFEPVLNTLSGNSGGPRWRERSLTETEREICIALKDGELQIDYIAEKTGRRPHDLLPVLLELEMEEFIVQRAGKYFELK